MFKMMVVPDYMPDQFSAWYLLNTHLQKTADIHIGLVMPESFAEVAGHEGPEARVPDGAVASVVRRVGTDVPPLDYRTQEAGVDKGRAMRVVQVPGFHDAVLLVLKALQ